MKLMLRATINIPQTNNLWKRKISPWKRVASWLLWSKSMTNQMIYTVLFWLFFRDCKIKNNLYQEKKLSDNTSALGSISSHTEYPISNFFGHTCLYFYGLFPISLNNHRHITKSAQTIGKSLRLRWERVQVMRILCTTHTLAWGFFLEKSQARPRSEILTWPFSSSKILAGCQVKQSMASIQVWKNTYTPTIRGTEFDIFRDYHLKTDSEIGELLRQVYLRELEFGQVHAP